MLVPLNDEVRMLHSSDILEPLSEEELADFAKNNTDVQLEEGEILFGPEEVGERLFIVKQGRIRLYKVGSEGNEITIAMVYPGKLFGELALTAQRTREVYAQAAEPSLLISLNREALENLILEKPRVGLRLIERLSERVRALESRLEDATLKEMPARLANLILQLVENEGERTEEGYHKIPTHYSHDDLASMVGANRVSVTRALGRLRESGVVELRRRLIYVKDLQALGNIATESRRAKQIEDSEE